MNKKKNNKGEEEMYEEMFRYGATLEDLLREAEITSEELEEVEG